MSFFTQQKKYNYSAVKLQSVFKNYFAINTKTLHLKENGETLLLPVYPDLFIFYLSFAKSPKNNAMKPVFFASPAEFRDWLKKNHFTKTELLVGFYKVGTGLPSMSWPESVDEALCYGWIDGIRKSAGDTSYTIRFTPRKATSIWSTINIKKMEVLIKEKRMQPAGLAAFKKRKEEKSNIYSHEKEAIELDPEFEKQFKKNKRAWIFFQSLAPSYKKVAIHWVMDAKQAATKLSRLKQLIKGSEEEKRIR